MAAFNSPGPLNPQNFTVTLAGIPINRQNFDVVPPGEPLAAPTSDLALKTPVRAATTGSNITLSGLQTIDGVSLAAGDRVLVKDQTDQTTNGIYNVQIGTWTRSLDANSSLQWAQGVQVSVTQGTINVGVGFQVTTANPIILGTSTLTFVSEFVFFNIQTFGGKGDGVTDNTAAFNAALAAISGNGGCIYFPPGKYKFASAVSFTMPNRLFSVAIVGAGQDVTTLYWPNAAGGLTINYGNIAYASTAHIRDLSFTTGQAGGGTGVSLIGNALTLGTSDLYRVTFRGDDGYNISDYWTIGIAVDFISDLNLEGVMVIGQGTLSGAATNLHGTGLSVVGNVAGSEYAVQINVAKSNFSVLSTGIQFGSFVQGLTVDQCNFTGVGNGIVAPGSETGTLAGISVTNSQFGLYNSNTNAIFTATAVNNLMIANNFFFVNSTASAANGVNLTANFHFNIYGNQFASEGASFGQIAIYVDTTTSGGAGVIANNDIFAWDFGIDLDTGSSGTLVIGNTLENNTTAIANAGTNNFIVNNLGFNPSITIAGVGGKTLTVDNSLILAGTDATTITFQATDTYVGRATTDTLTNKTLDSAGTGNVLKVSGVQLSAGEFPGTTTNDSATAGNIGEYQTASASGVSLSNGVTANITSKSLTAGDWEITGVIILAPAGALTGVIGLASLTTASLTPLEAGNFLQLNGTLGTAAGQTLPLPATRLSIASTTTVYLNINASFTSTATGGGILRARRVR